MIENMRKYTGLMVVVLILLAAGLVITMKPGGSGGGGVGTEFMHVNGVALDRNDYAKEGKNTLMMVRQSGYQLMDFAGTLSGVNGFAILQGRYSEQHVLNFVTNRILLKQAAEDLGLYSSPEVATKYIQDNMFQGRDGVYDPELYSNFVKGLPDLGLKEKDFKQIVAEHLVYTKTRDLIGGGLTPSAQETIAEDKLNRQSIGMSVVEFKIDEFKKDLAPSEEEIKAYWETHKDKYKTDRQVQVTYALTLVDDSDKPQRPTPAADADPETVSTENLKYQESLAQWTEQRKGHTNILTNIFDDFLFAVEESSGKDFEKAAAAAKEQAGEDFKVVTTAPFTFDSLPAELSALQPKNTLAGAQMANVIFSMKMSADLMYNINNFGVSPDGHIAIRLDKDIQPEVKSYDDAKELAKADLITKLATEAMTAAAKETQATLTEAVAAGTPFAEAATAANRTATELAPFDASTPPANTPNAADYFRIAQVSAQKTVATELSTSDDSSTIVYVASRTLEVEGDEALKQTQLLENEKNKFKYTAFNAWLNSLKDNAELNLPSVR